MMSPDQMSSLLPVPPHWVSHLRRFIRDNPELMRDLNTTPIPAEMVERWRVATVSAPVGVPVGVQEELDAVLKEFVASMAVLDRMNRAVEEL